MHAKNDVCLSFPPSLFKDVRPLTVWGSWLRGGEGFFADVIKYWIDFRSGTKTGWRRG